jgi:alkylation response protein AidB-like acyl-CoA dehydrogenase
MELLLNEQQTQLRDSAVRLCAAFGGTARARSHSAEVDAASWAAVTEAGWVATLVPEDVGGLGLGVVELCLLLQEAGRGFLTAPLTSAAIAAWAIARGENARLRDEILPGLIAGRRLVAPAATGRSAGYSAEPALPMLRRDGGAPRLDGEHSFVRDAATADAFLVACDSDILSLVAKDAPGLTIATSKAIDGTSTSRLVFADVAVGDTTSGLAAELQDLLTLAVSAELLGIADAALRMTLEHLRLRQQFGRPIGSFQALQHRAVNGFVDLELILSLLFRTAAAWDRGERNPAFVAAVKAKTGKSALGILRFGLQMHGAMGYTDAHDIGLLYKRALVLSALHGNEANHLVRFSRLTGIANFSSPLEGEDGRSQGLRSGGGTRAKRAKGLKKHALGRQRPPPVNADALPSSPSRGEEKSG